MFTARMLTFTPFSIYSTKNMLEYNKYIEGGKAMKKFITRYSSWLAAFAMVVTTATVNSACIFFMHQEKLPDTAKKLRKF